jgi:hypothetical protein
MPRRSCAHPALMVRSRLPIERSTSSSCSSRTLEQATEGHFGPGVVRLAAWSYRDVLT